MVVLGVNMNRSEQFNKIYKGTSAYNYETGKLLSLRFRKNCLVKVAYHLDMKAAAKDKFISFKTPIIIGHIGSRAIYQIEQAKKLSSISIESDKFSEIERLKEEWYKYYAKDTAPHIHVHTVRGVLRNNDQLLCDKMRLLLAANKAKPFKRIQLPDTVYYTGGSVISAKEIKEEWGEYFQIIYTDDFVRKNLIVSRLFDA